MTERQVNKTPQKDEAKKINTLLGIRGTPCGSDIAPVYKRVYDKEVGKNIVKKVDDFNLFEFIQASRSSTDLALLEKRYLELGEIPNADPTAAGVDFAVMPSNIHEVYDMVNDVDGNFKKLPKCVQDIFGTSQAYFKSLMDGTYQATLLEAIKKASKPAEEPKKGEGE